MSYLLRRLALAAIPIDLSKLAINNQGSLIKEKTTKWEPSYAFDTSPEYSLQHSAAARLNVFTVSAWCFRTHGGDAFDPISRLC
jgi:hypothetical protein